MKTITQIWTWLSGRKTYIIAFAGAIYGAGIQTGLWPHNTAVDVILGSTATATIRHGISTNSAQPTSETPKQ